MSKAITPSPPPPFGDETQAHPSYFGVYGLEFSCAVHAVASTQLAALVVFAHTR